MHRRPTARAVAGAAVLVMLAGACSSSDSSDAAGSPATTGGGDGAADVVYPGDDWDEADAEEMGFDPARLDEVASGAEAADSNCLLVTRRGQIVGEWYWDDTDETTAQEVFSATKSYGSTLVGIAQAEGHLDIDDPVAEYIPEWADTPSEDVTIRNLLSNDSGREWSLAIDYGQMVGSGDTTTFGIELSQDAPPGTTWAYNNSAIQTLDAVIEAATGEETADYARDKLLDPIGMSGSEMSHDAAGNTLVFMGLQSTCRDMARFGYLFLRQGNWDGTQVVPEEWVAEATTPSQEINPGYGFLWWLNHPGGRRDVTRATGAGEDGGEGAAGQAADGAPEDMYWALGLGGQVISVDPGSETVVVRLGPGRVDGPSAQWGPAQAAEVVTSALTDP
jgi:CubicO group peptidase (beta-lactamase class C family)